MLRCGPTRLLPALALPALLVASCSSDEAEPASEAAESAGKQVDAITSGGCSTEDPPAPGTELTVHRFGSVDRQVERTVPPSYDGSEPHPLILSLHGFSSSIEQIDLFSGLPEAASERGYLLLTPQAEPATVPVAGQEMTAPIWNLGQEGLDDLSGIQDDVGFLLDLLDAAEGELCVDTDRIYVTGNSNGAGMATTLACEAPGRLAAIAPVSGINLAVPCADLSPVSLIGFHGDADPLVPYPGGTSPRTGLETEPVQDAAARFAAADGCSENAEVTRPFEDIQLDRWAGCREGFDVELYTVRGGGHTWPGMLNYVDVTTLAEVGANQSLAGLTGLDLGEIAGNMTTSIEATALMLDFFDGHRRASG